MDTAASCSSPSFVKTIRSFNMQCDELEIPASFVKEHGDRFQKTIALQGPSGRMKSMRLRIQSRSQMGGQDRVHIRGEGWKAFVVDNGFKAGHQLVFSLVSMSTFTVRLLENSAPPAPAKQHSLSVERDNNKTSLAGMKSTSRPSGNVKNDVVYTNGTLQYKLEVEALLKNLQCPHFVTVIRQSNLRHCGSSALCVPVQFVKKYGTYISEVQFLQGPSGGTVEVKFSRGTKGAIFSSGWKAFSKENDIKLGDLLLFSLRAPARWLVQVVENGRSEELGVGNLCIRNHLD